MPEEIKAQSEAQGTEPTPMPSVEQTESPKVASEEVVAEKPVAEPSKATEDFELPEEVSRRTREQFNKLRDQLAYYKNREKDTMSTYGVTTPLYDLETGLINPQGLDSLSQTAVLAEERARQAEAKLNRYLDSIQEKEAYAEFPELDPSNRSFNKDFHKAVRGYITDSMVNPMDYGGRELTMAEAAKLLTSFGSKKIETIKKEAAKEVINGLTPKEEASLEARGRSDKAPVDDVDIRERSRSGDRLAVIERLKKLSGK